MIKRKPLEKELLGLKGVRFGEVKYLRLEDVGCLTKDDLDTLPFVKRVGFAAEKEYRITAQTTEAQQPVIVIDFPISMISKICLNPWMPESIAESVTATLRGLPDCERLRVQKSYLIDSARWKDAGDVVVGKEKLKIIKLRKAK